MNIHKEARAFIPNAHKDRKTILRELRAETLHFVQEVNKMFVDVSQKATYWFLKFDYNSFFWTPLAQPKFRIDLGEKDSTRFIHPKGCQLGFANKDLRLF